MKKLRNFKHDERPFLDIFHINLQKVIHSSCCCDQRRTAKLSYYRCITSTVKCIFSYEFVL